ncbi:MAG: hypothetical protein IRY95_06635 [Clostridia bacterium]|nr:hypothetical protein [Clostridia bacterium]
MIIRILSEGQYRLPADVLAELDRVDDAVLDAVENGDAEAFRRSLQNVVDLVRQRGSRVADDELVESDLVLPPPDTTLEEARQLFADYPRHLV